MSEHKIKIGEVVSRAHIGSYNAADGTVRVTFATEKKVLIRSWQGDYYQVLVCEQSAIRSSRLNNGAVHLLDNHNHSSVEKVFGNVVRWGIENKECWADVKLTNRKDAEGTVQDIKDGILRTVSIYAKPHGAIQMPLLEGESIPTVNVNDWEPLEISLAPVAEDEGSIIRSRKEGEHEIEVTNSTIIKRSQMEGNTTTQDTNTPAATTATTAAPATGTQASAQTQTPEAPAAVAEPDPIQRSAAPAQTSAPATQVAQATAVNVPTEILRSCQAAGLDLNFATELVGRNLSLDVSRAAIIDEIARRNPNNMRNNTPAPAAVTGGANERDIIRNAAITGLMHRAEPGSVDMSMPENAKAHEYKYARMLDVAKRCLEMNGANTMLMSSNEIVSRAISTTDFPDILTGATDRMLRKYYDKVIPEWKRFFTQENASDFREKTGIKVDANVTFEELAEGGEYKETKIMSNEKMKLQLNTFARQISVTRKAIINDDLKVISMLPRWGALGAAEFQALKAWGLVTGNVKTPDNVDLFHATHGNLPGTGAIISEESLSAARVAMRRQKSPEGNIIRVKPKYLLVPAELETVAEKNMQAIIATTTGDVNVFAKSLEIVVVDYFDNPKEWYLASDPNTIMAEGLVYSYLEGQEGLWTDTYVDPKNDNIVTKFRLDFDCRAWGHQGWYKNKGAAASSGQ